MNKLSKIILSKFFKRSWGERKIIEIGSREMVIPKDAHWCFSTGDYYEKNVIYWLEKIIQLKKGQTIFYEIGSNYGYYVVRFADQCRLFYAFEPVASTYKVLKENITRNGIKNAISVNKGISDREGSAKIFTYTSSLNNSLFRRRIPQGHSLREKGTELIELTTLDKIQEESKMLIPDIIKIDTEGAELAALKGARNLISVAKPILLFEYSDSTANDADYKKEEILRFLNPFGYNFFGLSEDQNDVNLIPAERIAKEAIANILATPTTMTL